MVEVNSAVGLWCVWIAMATGQLIWSTLPQLLLLLWRPADWESGENVTARVPVSSLLHRPFPEERRVHLRNEVRRMFHWGYDNYMKHAFPEDELNPLDCTGRGHDWDTPSNININDVLGDYSLTLVDTLDTLAVMGDRDEFKRAVQLVIKHVDFSTCSTVQVFEATIRVLGSLLSAHLLMVDPEQPFGSIAPAGYSNELLHLAHNLAARLLPAFENTTTGLPYPRVNLCEGLPSQSYVQTCTAGAGTLTVEFGLLSRLLGDPVYENLARQAVRRLWERRHMKTGLLGNVIDVHTAQWVGTMSGLGAGLDSFYEYLLKSYILFGEREDLEMFKQVYSSIMRYLRRGPKCQELIKGHLVTTPPYYVNVEYSTGSLVNQWLDSLSASFAGLQVLAGDIDEAICSHALYYSIWRRYGALPERFDWSKKNTAVPFYPLRPELVESTYLLYQATKNPFYLHVGSDIFASLEKHTKARCGYATIHDVNSKSLEDRMESFFLSETCKYLYLLFDTDNVINQQASHYTFTTEGHVIKLKSFFRRSVWQDMSCDHTHCYKTPYENISRAVSRLNDTNQCPSFSTHRKHALPLGRQQLGLLESFAGLH